MRFSASFRTRKSSLRLVAVFLLAGTAAGCSSDASRFNGIFSPKTDDMATNSIPHKARDVNGALPVPRGTVANDQSGDVSDNTIAADISYEPVKTTNNGISGVRAAVTPMKVERVSLDAPSLAEPVVVVEKPQVRQPKVVAKISEKAKPGKASWQVSDNSPKIVLKSGETISLLSRRYGVPERELLRANGLKTARAAQAGQTIVIPTLGGSGTLAAAKADADELADSGKKKLPDPIKTKEQVAVLPSNSRDKSKVTSDQKLASSEGQSDKAGDSVYVVKSGDSLARIAKAHKTSVDALKAANGLTTAQLRIGQKLRLSGQAEMPTSKIAAARTDGTTTGAIPSASKVTEVSEAKPSTYKAPVDTKSVDEVAKTDDVKQTAPESTGISKYRWPVRGQVVAGYGANVEGKRNTGIDISVPEGTAVKAAENGVVIYSGAGLKELGNTVLIRHDDGTVTVYGNASELKVQRGEKVQRGQTIASSGMTGGAKQPKLHFEVRKSSSPVNPITFLE